MYSALVERSLSFKVAGNNILKESFAAILISLLPLASLSQSQSPCTDVHLLIVLWSHALDLGIPPGIRGMGQWRPGPGWAGEGGRNVSGRWPGAALNVDSSRRSRA